MADIKEILKSFEDYLDYKKSLAYSTKVKYLKILRLFLIRTGLKFTVEDMNVFITESNKGKNCYPYKYALVLFLESIGKKHLVDELKSVKRNARKKVFKFIPKPELQRIINMLPDKYRFLALFQLKTGCRFLEAVTIRIENFDFDRDEDIIYINIGTDKSKTKGGKERKVFLARKYEGYFRDLMTKHYGYLFLDKKVELLKEEKMFNYLENFKRYYNAELQKAASSFGYETFSSHELRHHFADYFMEAGGTVEQLKVLMGHEKIDTTLAYVSIGEKQALSVLKKLG